MGFGLGIDVGTTFTGACVAARDGLRTVELGQRAAALPTVVHIGPANEPTVGDAAERRAATEPERVVRAFKRRFGDTTAMVVGGTPWTAHALTAIVLRHVVEAVTVEQGGPPSAAVLTHPADWGAYKLELLAGAGTTAGLGRLQLCPEPVAAAISYATEDRVVDGEVVGVYDFGGGTFDAAVLRKVPGGFEMLGRPQGLDRVGGVDLDELVLGMVRSAVDDGAAFERDEPDVRAALLQLRRDCVEAKEALALEQVVSVPVHLPGGTRRVRLSRTELESAARPLVERTVTTMVSTVEAAGLSPGDLHRVLLVGGSSRLPLVGALLGNVFPRVVRDANPKQVVARGAALLAYRSLTDEGGAPPPEPGPRPPRWPTPPEPAPEPPPGPTRRWAVPAAVAGVVVLVALVVALTRGGGGEGDLAVDETTTTTAGDGDDATPTTAAPGSSDSPFLFEARPIEGESGPVAGLRGVLTFTQVDRDLASRLFEVDDEYPGTNGPAEAYDAVVVAALAAAATGTDGSALATEIPDVTDGGETCETPADCLALVEDGEDIAYVGLSGSTTMDPSGNRVAARTEIVEFDADGDAAGQTEVDARYLAPLDIDSPSPARRAGDGALRVVFVQPDEPSAFDLAARAGARLAVADLNEAGGVLGEPVELVEISSPDGPASALDDVLAAEPDVVLMIETNNASAATTAGLTGADIVVLDPGGRSAHQVARDDGGLYFTFGPGAFVEVATLAAATADTAPGPVTIVVGESAAGFAEVTGDFLVDQFGAVGFPGAVEVVGWDGNAGSADEVAEDVAASGPAVVVLLTGDVSLAPVLEAMAAAGVGPTDVFVYVDSFATLDGAVVDELLG